MREVKILLPDPKTYRLRTRGWLWPPIILSALLCGYLLWTRIAASPRPFLYAPF